MKTWFYKNWFEFSICAIIIGFMISVVALINSQVSPDENMLIVKNILIYLLISIAIILIIREVLCWYWKINKLVLYLESIDCSMKKLVDLNKESTKN
jgi:hypothetical protein